MMQLITNRGGHMINIPIMVKTIERAIRIVPFVKELLPSNKDGLNSLIQEDPLQSDSDEILKLNKKIKEQDKALYAKKQEIAVLEKQIKELEDCNEEYRQANKYT